MKNTKRKGFTIVELVIVIAVIAILAAVLIPTFASLINKANRSADIQAVHQMNTLLATYTDGSVKTVSDAVKALNAENIDLEDYKALQSNHYFYFVLDKNGTPMVIYADANDKIVFPENANVADDAQWMSLSGAVPTSSDYMVDPDGKVTIDSGAKLAHLIESKKNTSEALEITLSGNVDLKGAAVDFGATAANITIKDGTLSGLRANDNTVSPTSGEYANHPYGFGIFGNIKSGTVKLENVTISGLDVGDKTMDHQKGANTIGLVAGYIQKGATVELNGVTFKDCVVNGYQKVGGIVGQLHGTLNMTEVKFENVSVNGAIEIAKVAGYVGTGNLTVTDNTDFSGITTVALVDTFTKGAFGVKINEIDITLKGSEGNTFTLTEGNIYAATTDDWAWYSMKKENLSYTQESRKDAATYNGQQYFLNGITFSASTNFTDGKPATN